MGTLYIVSTPIGNLADITIRALKILACVQIIAAEDTRRTRLLINELHTRFPDLFEKWNNKTTQTFVRFDDKIEAQRAPELIEALESGSSVALVSDAGTPLINDPGFVLVRECIKRTIPIVSIPGPSAAVAALTISGLPSDCFIYMGYPPEKQAARKKTFETNRLIASVRPCTFIYYVAPHKLTEALKDMLETFGDISIVLARELTKMHEEMWRGKITEAIEAQSLAKGEIVLLFRLASV